jgi:hypothetical protein
MNRKEALVLDFQSTQDFIGKCDDHMFKIKNWALITTSAVVAYSISSNTEFVVFANLVLVLAFLYLELVYKSFQDSAIDHSTDISERIDKALSGDDVKHTVGSGYEFGFGRKLQYPSLKQCWNVLRNKNRRHIVRFYGMISIFSIGAYLLNRSY